MSLKSALIPLVLILPLLAAFAQESHNPPLLTLEEAISLAVQQNRLIHSSALEVLKLDDKMAATRTLRYPYFSWYTFGSQRITGLDFIFPAGSFGTNPPIPATDTAIHAAATPAVLLMGRIDQPLSQQYRIGLNLHSIDMERQIAVQQERLQKQSVVDQVKRTYYGILQMQSSATMKIDSGTFKIDGAFSMRLVGTSDARTADAFNGFTDRLSVRTGIPIRVREVDGQTPVSLEVVWKSKLTQVPAMIEDESYTLRIGEEGGSLRANSFYGILRGLETYLQLVELNTEGFYVPFVTIHDAPRFPWRGLLIDACRHWMPVEVIKRNLDAMAMV